MKLSESGKHRGLVAYNEALASMKAGIFATRPIFPWKARNLPTIPI
jgi:hypothetical protein